MTSRVNSNLVQDKTVAGDQRLSQSLSQIRAIIADLSSTTLIKPEQFGAVANDPAAANNNRAALQAWFDAADTGVLWHNPRNVYYVATSTTPLRIKERAEITWLRLRPVIAAGGTQKLLDFSPDLGTPVALAANQAVARGQSTFNLPPLATPPAVGTRALIRAGQDAYTSSEAGWQELVTVSAIDTSNPLQPKVTLDRGAPRAFAAPPLTGGASAQLVPITAPAGAGKINWLEIDERGQNNTLAEAISFFACGPTLIRRYTHHAARAPAIHFKAASEGVRIADYYNRLPLTRTGGGVVASKDIGNRIDFYKVDTKTDHTAFTRSAYSRGLTCERLDVQKYGRTAWGSFLLVSSQEADAMGVGLVNIIDDLDSGFRLAGQSTGGKAPQVRLLVMDKDPLFLGCLPGYIQSKTIEGPLSHLVKEMVTPALTPATPEDQFLARMWLPRVEVWLSDVTAVSWDLYTPNFDAAGSGRSRLNFPYEVAETGATPIATNTWVVFLDETNPAQNGSIANGAAFNSSAANSERWLRASVTTNQAAGKRARLRLHGYPLKSTYTATNTGP